MIIMSRQNACVASSNTLVHRLQIQSTMIFLPAEAQPVKQKNKPGIHRVLIPVFVRKEFLFFIDSPTKPKTSLYLTEEVGKH